MDWLETIQRCFGSDDVLYSHHARLEMQTEEFGPISEQEIYQASVNAEVIESYPDDEPFPSVLIFGLTQSGRPIHLVCAYIKPSNQVVVVTVYHPSPDRWENYRRRVR